DPGSTGGGIYLQAPLTNISVIGNICVGNEHGIRTALVDSSLDLSNFQVMNNVVRNSGTYDLLLNVKQELLCTGNSAGGANVTISYPERITAPLLVGNTITGILRLAGCDNPKVIG